MIWKAVRRFLGEDARGFEAWQEILVKAFTGVSFSDIERGIKRFLRTLVLTKTTSKDLVAELVRRRAEELDSSARIDWAVDLARADLLSQRAVSEITCVSRDTIRKHLKLDASDESETRTGKAARS